MKIVNDILETFIKKVAHSNNDQERPTYKADSKKTTSSYSSKKLNYNPSSKQVKKIKKMGFTICDFYTLAQSYGRDKEIYKCQCGDWFFSAEYFESYDKSDYSLIMKEVYNPKEGVRLTDWCDLFCRSTPQSRLDSYLYIFEHGYHAYQRSKFSFFLTLPEQLKQRGYEIDVCDFTFDVVNNYGYIRIDKDVYIRAFKGHQDEIKMVVTNNKKWDVNFLFLPNTPNKAYTFDYQTYPNIDELCVCIESFKRHVSGNYGFKTQGNNGDTYLNGVHIREQIDKTIAELKDTRGYLFQKNVVEVKKNKQYPFYPKNKVINCYKGIEIAEQYTLTIKRNEHSSAIVYHIVFDYNKKKNADFCFLQITQFVIPAGKEKDWMHEKNVDIYKIDKFERYDTFQALMSLLTEFIQRNVDALSEKI